MGSLDVRASSKLTRSQCAGAGELAPAVVGGGVGAGVHGGEEVGVAHAAEGVGGVVEELGVGEEAGDWCAGVVLVEVLEIGGIDRALEAVLAEHVELELEWLLGADPVVLGAEMVELGARPRGLVVGEQEREQGHEVGLAAAEAAVEVGGLGAGVTEGAVEQAERLVEGVGEARGDDVGGDGLRGMGDTLGEGDGEVHLADLVGDVEELADFGHGRRAFVLLLKQRVMPFRAAWA